MAQKQLYSFLWVIFLSSCSLLDIDEDTSPYRFEANTREETNILDLQSEALASVDVPKVRPVVAVYGNAFTDQTGQRKSNSEFALFSSALTQEPSALLIRALKHAGEGKFFRVVERAGIENLTKERQIIRSTRQDNTDETPLRALLFAGVLIEGAVVSYDTNLRTGGIGSRYLGVGSNYQYREDSVTISIRMVSVATGEILIEVLSQKTIYSYGQTQDVFKFIEMGTELVELEAGVSRNESSVLALMKAIEGAVLELINIGYLKGYWSKYEEEL